jgi:hypothetical protein
MPKRQTETNWRQMAVWYGGFVLLVLAGGAPFVWRDVQRQRKEAEHQAKEAAFNQGQQAFINGNSTQPAAYQDLWQAGWDSAKEKQAEDSRLAQQERNRVLDERKEAERWLPVLRQANQRLTDTFYKTENGQRLLKQLLVKKKALDREREDGPPTIYESAYHYYVQYQSQEIAKGMRELERAEYEYIRDLLFSHHVSTVEQWMAIKDLCYEHLQPSER